MVVRNDNDTMFVSAGGTSYYSWILSPDGRDLNLPIVFHFQKGLFYLKRLKEDKSFTVLFNSIHRTELLKLSDAFSGGPASIRIRKSATGKSIYRTNDTLIIELTGKLLNDGACNGGNILWTLQMRVANHWIVIKDNFLQMDCGVGPSILDNAAIPLFIICEKDEEIQSTPQQFHLQAGKYRLVVYDDYYKPYFTNDFRFE